MATDAPTLEGRLPGVGRVSVLRRAATFATNHPVWTIFLLALAARVVVAVGIAIIHPHNLAPDTEVYSRLAATKATGHTASWDWFDHYLWGHVATLLWPITWLYAVFGTHQFVGSLYLVFLGAGTAAVTTRLAMEFLPLRWALVVGVIVAFMPTQILWSSLILKDAAVWFALAGLALTIAVAGRSQGFRLALLGLVAAGLLFLLGYLRYQTLIVAAWALMLASPFGVREWRFQRIGGALALGVLLPWFVFDLGPAGLTFVRNSRPPTDVRAWNAVGANSAIPTGTKKIIHQGNGYYVRVPNAAAKPPSSAKPHPAGGAQPTPTSTPSAHPAPASRPHPAPAPHKPPPATTLVTATNPAVSDSAQEVSADVKHLPSGLEAMLVQPFPWRSTGSTSLNMARVGAIIWYPLLILAAIGLACLRPRHLRVMAFPLLAGGAILLLYALTEGNLGTAFRHRGEFEWVIALLAGFGLWQLVKWRARRRAPAAMVAA